MLRPRRVVSHCPEGRIASKAGLLPSRQRRAGWSAPDRARSSCGALGRVLFPVLRPPTHGHPSLFGWPLDRTARRAAAGAARCGFVRIRAADGRMHGGNRRDRTADEQSRSVAALDPRGARASPHLAPAPRRRRQDQHLDPGEGSLRPPSVHARDDDPARGGARRRRCAGNGAAVAGRSPPASRLRISGPTPARRCCGSRAPTSRSGRPSATRTGSMPTGPRSSGTRRGSCLDLPRVRSASTPPSRNTARCRCRTNRATSISSRTTTGNTGSLPWRARPSAARCMAS